MRPLHMAFVVLPYEQLRSYPDVGDWQVNADGSPALIVSADFGNDVSNAAVLLHEFIEAFCCWKAGVKESEVVKFDTMWYKEQEAGKHKPDDEPGYDQRCPYREWHLVAEQFERAFISQNGMMWQHHVERINAVTEGKQNDNVTGSDGRCEHRGTTDRVPRISNSAGYYRRPGMVHREMGAPDSATD